MGEIFERACETFAAITEVRRADEGQGNAPFWHGATDDQRRATRETVLWLLEDRSVKHWHRPEHAEHVRAALMRMVGGPEAARKLVTRPVWPGTSTATETRSRKWGLATAPVTDGLRTEDDASPWSPEEIARARRLCAVHARPGNDVPYFADPAFLATARSLLPAALLRIEQLQRQVVHLENASEAAVAVAARERDMALARIAELEATIAAQAQEIGRLRAAEPGTEIAVALPCGHRFDDLGQPASGATVCRACLVDGKRLTSVTEALLCAAREEVERHRSTINVLKRRLVEASAALLERDNGTEIAPGVRLVWQRGDVGVLAFEPGAVVPEESHDRDEAGVVLMGSMSVIPFDDEIQYLEPWWRVPAGLPHTMTAGPEGAVVGLRWVIEKPGLTGEQFAAEQATERAANPLISYMPIDGLSTEAIADGLRGMALGALRHVTESGGRVAGLKVMVIEEGSDAAVPEISTVKS